MYYSFFKRMFDIILGSVLFIITLPVISVVIIILFFTNRGKVFFFQQRPGKNEKIFSIIKFRTMNEKKNIEGVLLADNERLTKFGKFIRSSSIDELPQLINVIKGDLSLIGPRPLLVEYLPLYDDFQRKRHKVKPGITGWAQVNGRNSISWDEKFKLDVFYVDNVSFTLDFRILYRTFINIIRKSDIYTSEGLTMAKFTGKKL